MNNQEAIERITSLENTLEKYFVISEKGRETFALAREALKNAKNDIELSRMTFGEIREVVGLPALYEGLAEEATELAHAALKIARILRGENPTPSGPEEARNATIEEFTDLIIYADVLGILCDPEIYSWKRDRMDRRIREANT